MNPRRIMIILELTVVWEHTVFTRILVQTLQRSRLLISSAYKHVWIRAWATRSNSLSVQSHLFYYPFGSLGRPPNEISKHYLPWRSEKTSCFEFNFLATLNIKTWEWPKSSLLEESKHGQFNRDQGRQEPSGEDTALMIDCNTSSSAQPESNNCCDYCASLSHNDQGGNLNSAGPGAWAVLWTSPFSKKTLLIELQIWSRVTLGSRTGCGWEWITFFQGHRTTMPYRGASASWFWFNQ